jgi:N-methylhydantoinase A
VTAGSLRIGIDTGGTFTDVVAFDERTGQLAVTKTPTTPADPSLGFTDGLLKVLAQFGPDYGPGQVAAISHGTTIATNQLLEGKTGRLGFITTAGFEFMLEIARQSVPDGYGNSYFWVKPPRIVPPDLVRTVAGRLDHTGAEIVPFDAAGAVAAARWFRENDVNAIGVCFLHSYANTEHERRMADILAAEHPAAVVSVSSQVLREYREYERSMTTLLDAAVKPTVARYLRAIADRLSKLEARMPFYVMKSNGGVVAAAEVASQPIATVLSGPAAGALGAAFVARAAGIDRVLTCDGGGTSTDVAVVHGGEPALTTEGSVGGYPAMIPMVDVVTVGAGGGSIAWISPEGALKVGPRSAGADPGPLCYGRGGTEVTVTDAHLALGRTPAQLLGGELRLDPDAARAGLARLAGRLGLCERDCASGILEISAWNQANAVRQITVKRGLDIRDFTLVTFGGSGSLLLCPLLDILGVREVLVPLNPGNLSAFGLLTVDVRLDFVRTWVRRHDLLDCQAVEAVFRQLAAQAQAGLAGQGFGADRWRLVRSADLRYFGQAYEVRVPVPDGVFDAGLAAQVADGFHDAHRALYGYHFRGAARQPVEWVNLRVTGIGPIRAPVLPEMKPGDGNQERARTGTRAVCFSRSDGFVPAGVYWRPGLACADTVPGPAVIEEFGATVPLHPGFAARVDRLGNLRVTRQ